MNIRFEMSDLKQAIDRMFLEYPELQDDETLRADMFEGETQFHSVLERIVDLSLDASSMSEAIKLRMNDLRDRKARFDFKEDCLRNLISNLMEVANLAKVILTSATLSVRNIAPSPIVIDETQLPENCIRIKREPDMKAIKEQTEQGIAVAGTAMGNGKQSLTIRVK